MRWESWDTTMHHRICLQNIICHIHTTAMLNRPRGLLSKVFSWISSLAKIRGKRGQERSESIISQQCSLPKLEKILHQRRKKWETIKRWGNSLSVTAEKPHDPLLHYKSGKISLQIVSSVNTPHSQTSDPINDSIKVIQLGPAWFIYFFEYIVKYVYGFRRLW